MMSLSEPATRITLAACEVHVRGAFSASRDNRSFIAFRISPTIDGSPFTACACCICLENENKWTTKILPKNSRTFVLFFHKKFLI